MTPLKTSDSEFYYPNRFVKARPFVQRLSKKYLNINTSNRDEFSKANLDYLLEYGKELKQEHLPILGEGIQFLMQEEVFEFFDYLTFYRSGRNIFYFSPTIADMFKNTDVDKIQLFDIQLPYKNFYISFGGQPDFKLTHQRIKPNTNTGEVESVFEDCFVDGAYIIADDQHFEQDKFKIVFTTVNYNNDYRKDWKLKRECPPEFPYYVDPNCRERVESFSIDFDKSLTVGEVIDRVIKRESVNPDQARFFEEFGVIAKNCFNLLFNGLCYLTAYHGTEKPLFTENIPIDYKRKIQKKEGKLKDLKRVRDELSSLGYSKIRFLGYEFERTSTNVNGLHTISHWRRGFWRNQAHGASLKERKLLWIQPTIVNKQFGNPEKGKIYDV